MTPLSPSHSNSNSPFPSPAYAGAGLLASVQVAVRIRPIWPDEAKKDSRYALLADGSRSDSLTLDDVSLAAKRSTISPVGSTPSAGGAPGARSTDQKQYSFDHVFGTNASQELVFETAVAPILNHFIEGFNVTVIAYGQTGSGKTFTMGTGASGSAGSVSDPTSQGIVPRAANLTFLALEAKARDVLGFTWSAKVSFLEIYNDDVIDLFDWAPMSRVPATCLYRRLQTLHGKLPGSMLAAMLLLASHMPIYPIDTGPSLLAKGTQLRQTAATGANATSSRSHAIFSIVITQGFIAGDDVVGSITSKLNFVDLAGSERLKNTNAVGDRAKEGISINSGLLALGKVINALSASSARPSAAVHIPYRESKLTRLLQDSLGGNSQTLMIACLSPSVPDISESKSTLQFASRARSVRTRVAINK
ncbi:P-loop containing nucleoside triphosphate hydrolase protein, partial [Entophlyctis helioformis]